MTHSFEQTVAFGRELAKEIHAPALVLLEGDLGSGKTALAKGIVAGLGAAQEEEVSSPTFTLVHEYNGPVKVYHVDLYRVEGLGDFATLGVDELTSGHAVVIVEWGEKFSQIFRAPDLHVRLEHIGPEERCITIEAGTSTPRL